MKNFMILLAIGMSALFLSSCAVAKKDTPATTTETTKQVSEEMFGDHKLSELDAVEYPSYEEMNKDLNGDGATKVVKNGTDLEFVGGKVNTDGTTWIGYFLKK